MRSGWVGGGGVTDEKGGSRKRGGSGPPDPPPSGHAYGYSGEWSFKINTMSGNFQKSRINTYTWNLGTYDTSSERKELTLYDRIR